MDSKDSSPAGEGEPTRNEPALSTEEQLAIAIEALSEHVVLFDAEDRVVLANSAWRELNKGVVEFTKLGTRFEDHLRALIEKGLAPEASGREEEWLCERMERHLNPSGPFEVARQDGRWIRVYEQRLPNDGTILIISDITESKRVDQALRESEERFRDMAESASDWFWETGPDLRFTYDSKRYFEITGFRPEERIGTTRTRYVDSADQDADAEKWAAHLADLEAHRPFKNFEYAFALPTGHVCHVRISGTPKFDPYGEFLGYRGTGTDITERKRAEYELQTLAEQLEDKVRERTAELRAAQDELLHKERLATLGQLTATVNHELRNPLGTIRASIYAIDKKTRGHGLGVEAALDRAERGITRCADIVEELLDFTRTRELARQPTAVDPWIDDMLSDYTLPAGVELRLALASDAEACIDRERLRRVLINLADNACQAMTEDDANEAEGERVLTIESTAAEGRVEITVGDTGPGMPADVLERAFEPLFTTKGFGVGLGLPMVKQIVEQHGGGVDLACEEGSGTRVVVWLPMLQGERETA